jgi:hypothetical protein
MRQLVRVLFEDKTSITLTTIDDLTNHQRHCFRKLFRFPDYFSNQVLRAITRHRATHAPQDGLRTVAAGPEGRLRRSRSRSQPTTFTLSQDDVASFWSVKMDQQDRASQCWHLLCDPALSQDFMFFDSIHDFLNDFVSAHPDLAHIRQSVEDRTMYVEAVSATMAFTLGCREHHKISRGEFCSSNLTDTFCVVPNVPTDQVSAFSVVSMTKLMMEFRAMDRQGRGLVDIRALRISRLVQINEAVLQTIFEGEVVLLHSVVKGCINFTDYVFVSLSLRDRMSDLSLQYWFRILDHNHEGYLCAADIRYFYASKVAITRTLTRTRTRTRTRTLTNPNPNPNPNTLTPQPEP